jgi:hypothetical protein
MMLIVDHCQNDVVLDTNVLGHADNAASPQQESSLAILNWVRASSVTWMLDDQGKSAPDPKTSLLFQEYKRTLAPQGASIALFIQCLAFGRVSFAPRPGEAIRNTIRKLVPRNKNDCAVLGAAHGTVDKVLISNDLADFPQDVRRSVGKKLGVQILLADEAAA